MDPLHVCIALGPVAVYLVVLGLVNLTPHPVVTTGGRDWLALGTAIGGFVVAGPMELFLPETAAAYWGSFVWLLLIASYALLLVLIAMLLRPRLVIYNVTVEQLRPALAEVAARLDPEVRWAGDSLTLPQVELRLHIEAAPLVKNVQLVAAGPGQNLAAWRQLETELATSLRQLPGQPNPYGRMLLACGAVLAGGITWTLARDPAAVQQALVEMLRQ
jgi:hypothetical protein